MRFGDNRAIHIAGMINRNQTQKFSDYKFLGDQPYVTNTDIVYYASVLCIYLSILY